HTVTFTAWIRRDGTQAVWAPILFTRAGSSTAGFGFGDTPELRYHWNDTGYTFASGITVPDGQWCLAAMSVSPTGVTLHLRTPSGLQSATHTATIAAEEFDGPLQIGRDPGHASRRFKGWIDDVRIHSTALLAAEIEALYQEAASAPAVTLAVPENGSWTLATHVVLEASIPPGPAPPRRVDFLDGDTVIAAATAEPWKATVPSMPLGDHTLRARVAYGEWDYEAFSPPVSFTVLAEEPIPTMTLAVEASPAEGGTTSGSGDHPRGSSVPITAIPTEGWMFTG